MSKSKKKETNNKKKRNIIIAIAAAVLVLVIVIVCVLLSGKKSNEEQLKENLKKMGITYYENFHYPQIKAISDDMSDYIEGVRETGITITLDNLSKYSGIDKKLIDSMVNSKTNEKCDPEGTSVKVIPKEPYGKTDYDIEVTLDCGFDEK